ncbi:MAG: BamA/TamA family outer membrane protein [Paludibacter sp.]|nr:BamA/TamA family outer membrane protein [Paludibacter sp.]
MSYRKLVLFFAVMLILSACNVTKHVPDGEYLLNQTRIHSDVNNISQSDLKEYLRQTPNARAFGLFRLQLGIYNLAGKDTASWINKSLKRMGSAPVIFNQNMTDISVQQLQKLYVNRGFINAQVESQVKLKKKKAEVDYFIHSNRPYSIRRYNIKIKNEVLDRIATDTAKSLIRPGMNFDVDQLDAERSRVATAMRDRGYYHFNKEYLAYIADSSQVDHKIDLSLDLISTLKLNHDSLNKYMFQKFNVGKVIFFANTGAGINMDNIDFTKFDTVSFRDFYLIFEDQKFLKLDALINNTYINPHSVFNEKNVEKTYSALNSLGPIKYVNISFKEKNQNTLDCYIIIEPAKTVSFSTELEGTYTDGYWGGAWKLNGVNKNTFKGAEALTLQGRLAYEWQQGIWERELGGQVGLRFPKFMFPVGSFDFKRNIHANTEFTSNLSYQFRPSQFSALNAGAGVNYSWVRTKFTHTFELFNLSYMDYTVDPVFYSTYLATGIYNKYNYNSRFILRSGYTGSFSTFNPNRPLRNYSTYRYSIESAGNLLYGLNKLLGTPVSSDGNYQLFGIGYSQYVRGEYNTTYHQILDKNNHLVYHFGFGLGFPYGNASIIPYERRFYSGGANSVRGWNESSLGPGIYQRDPSLASGRRDFNQVGDIKLDLNMEYRVKLFYVFEGALFLDGGNVWTIRDYEEQQGGVFKLNTFMKQLAIAYGTGIRMDFSFFIARFDFGLKLFDPSQSRVHQWQLGNDFSLKDDFAFHIAIGYPF